MPEDKGAADNGLRAGLGDLPDGALIHSAVELQGRHGTRAGGTQLA